MKNIRPWMPLILVTSISLFMELALIRWVSGEVQLFSYLKNIPLLAAFMGLSIGFALVGKGRDYRLSFAPLLTLLVALVLAFRISAFQRGTIFPGDDEFVWLATQLSYWLELALFLAISLIFFLMIMFVFIPLGQATGEEMALHSPVPAYIVNILASLLGIWVFTLLSYFETPPVVWFGLALLGMGGYLLYRKILKPLSVVLFGAVLIALVVFGQGVHWSPYNRITVTKLDSPTPDLDMGYSLDIQQVFYQHATNYSDEFIALVKGIDPEFGATVEKVGRAYSLPYQLIPEGSDVLIVGSGMGNDVAAALRGKAGSIDAVEIDPRIQQFGVQLHPEKPYDDPRVHAIIDDARSYFNQNTKKYDAVVFGLLDSQALLSAMSSVRLDSFVYTIESFKQVRSHLKDNGVVALTFAVTGNHWIPDRLGRMLAQVNPDRGIYYLPSQLGGTFIVGNVEPGKVSQMNLVTWQPNPEYDNLPLPTDDWPYLYLRQRVIPNAYWQVLLVAFLASLFIIGRSFPEALHPQWDFLLLGAAFLLIEFKSITELALLFGTTWLVNTLAISGVLLMALMANLFVLKRPNTNIHVIYGLLFVSMAVSFFFPLQWLAGLSPIIKGIAGIVLLSLPLFFAGIIFSETLRRTGETARPLASNFTGSVFGGMVEYSALAWGTKSLYLIGALFYIGAWIFSSLRKR